ncbi:hypothetical protein GCM10023321_64440 [Pseudonocardia eucalypti]|uniref:Uncharacterized protein n=1 Tax=Pseudonocardia eucalypti TaxID=648755 RepID=A0ABP9QXR4_9PSEU
MRGAFRARRRVLVTDCGDAAATEAGGFIERWLSPVDLMIEADRTSARYVTVAGPGPNPNFYTP